MTTDPISTLSDPERLATLRATGLLDSEPEESFDRFTRLAARLLDADVALVALVTPERQFFKSSVGLSQRLRETRETPLALSLCKHTVVNRERVVLDDLTSGPVPEARNVIEHLDLRSYAGVPLIIDEGVCVGAFTALDREPRDWSDDDLRLLEDLGAAVSSEIELRLEMAARRRAEHERQRRERRYRRLFEENVVGVARATLDGEILEANPAAAQMFGYEAPEEMTGRHATELYARPDEREELIAELEASGQVRNREYLAEREDGTTIHIIVNSTLTENPEAGRCEIVATILDVTERRRAQEALRRSEVRYRRLFENSRDMVYITDRDGRLVDINPAGAELLGRPREELLDRDVNVVEFFDDPHDRRRFRRSLDERGYVEDLEVEVETADGQIRDCLASSTERTDDDGAVVGFQGILRDVTEKKRFEEELEHRTLHDALTGLPSRSLFFDRLEQAVSRGQRGEGRIAVLFLDLDGFKAINDSLGHAAGDRVLAETARRLQQAVREPDTVARMAGDEFAVLLEDVDAPDAAREVARRIVEVMDPPFHAAGESVHLGASIGASFLTLEARGGDRGVETAENLVREASSAMFRAKDTASIRFAEYDPDRDVAAAGRIQRENELRRALERDEFVLHYQPIVELATGAVVGLEPLIRWASPDRGLVGPGDFLPLAEETGLIVSLDEWVLRESCRQLAEWRSRLDRPLAVCPNLSAAHFADPGITDLIGDLIAEFGLSPDGLELEVTEHVLLRAPDRTRRLAEMGVGVAIDDFGTGYSSLSYVRDLEVSSLKIDRSFVSGLGENPDDEAIVTTILTLGQTLDLGLVAEGVETEEQVRWLNDAGCPAVQGFYLMRPRPASDLDGVLEAGLATAGSG